MGTILTNPNVAYRVVDQEKGIREESVEYSYVVAEAPHPQWLSHPRTQSVLTESYVVPDPPKNTTNRSLPWMSLLVLRMVMRRILLRPFMSPFLETSEQLACDCFVQCLSCMMK